MLGTENTTCLWISYRRLFFFEVDLLMLYLLRWSEVGLAVLVWFGLV